jgi:hypothetical protein
LNIPITIENIDVSIEYTKKTYQSSGRIDIYQEFGTMVVSYRYTPVMTITGIFTATIGMLDGSGRYYGY